MIHHFDPKDLTPIERLERIVMVYKLDSLVPASTKFLHELETKAMKHLRRTSIASVLTHQALEEKIRINIFYFPVAMAREDFEENLFVAMRDRNFQRELLKQLQDLFTSTLEECDVDPKIKFLYSLKIKTEILADSVKANGPAILATILVNVAFYGLMFIMLEFFGIVGIVIFYAALTLCQVYSMMKKN
ncbi:MAG: hypothetical protein ACRCXZ_04330 [Patescibacteria group bacterium]